MADTMTVPWLPPGRTRLLPGRGEVFYRHHRHPDPGVPTLLLLHGWTASADLQFFTAYEALAQGYSFVGIDHRGHGRGLRSSAPFELEDAADDAAGLVEALGVGPVITIGYSMGGPISLLLAHRHPRLVSAMVLQATALEWRATVLERLRWKTVRLVGPILRSWAYPRWLPYVIRKLLGEGHPLAVYAAWIASEAHRTDAFAIVQAGNALSRYDARPWAAAIDKPAAVLITTADRLVKPSKQRELAAAVRAQVIELAGDHLATLVDHVAYSAATLELVRRVSARSDAVSDSNV